MRKQYVMEKRRKDGSLDLSAPQPPFIICTEDQITKYYFAHADIPAEQASASLDAIYGWFAQQGFTVRPKTW